MAYYELKNIATLNAKGVGYRCILWGISKNDANKLNNSVLEDEGILYIGFDANKTSIEIKERAFGGTYFREIILGLMRSGTKIHGKNLMS